MKFLLFITVLFSGLMAGLFYSYSCSVNIGLKSLTNTEYIKAMQSINSAIQNPVFFTAFMGLLVLFPTSTYQLHGQANALWLLIAAMVIYFLFVFGVTVFFNVPLNEQLAKFPITTSTEIEISQLRQGFEKPWNTYHTVRTIAAIVSFGLLILFLIKQKK